MPAAVLFGFYFENHSADNRNSKGQTVIYKNKKIQNLTYNLKFLNTDVIPQTRTIKKENRNPEISKHRSPSR